MLKEAHHFAFIIRRNLQLLNFKGVHKLNAFHQVGLDNITSLYDHPDWEDEDGCYNSSLFKSTTEFKSYTEVISCKIGK